MKVLKEAWMLTSCNKHHVETQHLESKYINTISLYIYPNEEPINIWTLQISIGQAIFSSVVPTNADILRIGIVQGLI